SDGESHNEVVCGTTVMSERSRSPKATLTTRAGRVLPAMPKSISQTSPRRGVGIVLVERGKQGVRSAADLLVRQRAGVPGQQPAQDLVGEGAFLLGRKLIEGVQQNLGVAAHRLLILTQELPAIRGTGVGISTTPKVRNSFWLSAHPHKLL